MKELIYIDGKPIEKRVALHSHELLEVAMELTRSLHEGMRMDQLKLLKRAEKAIKNINQIN